MAYESCDKEISDVSVETRIRDNVRPMHLVIMITKL